MKGLVMVASSSIRLAADGLGRAGWRCGVLGLTW
jgi:hypothetical protein